MPRAASLAKTQPPVILISIDTLRADHLGCYGYSAAVSPAIDRFRQDAVLFEQAIAQAPSTLPSHASMLSSRWPEHHGAFFLRKNALPGDILTLPEVLEASGYRTAAFTGGGQMAPEFGLGQGFEVYEVAGPQATTLGTTNRGLRWIEEQLNELQEEPFFLFLHTYEVHHPYTPRTEDLEALAPDYQGSLPAKISKELLKRINRGERPLVPGDLDYIIAAYDAEIRSMDAALGDFFEALARKGLYDRAVIVLTSDHGEEFGERGWVGWHSHTLHDELLAVPLLIKLPKSQHAGLSVAAQVRSIDIAPTILSLLGATKPADFDGVDLRGLMENPTFDPQLPALSQQDTQLGITHASMRRGPWKLYPNRLFHMQKLQPDAGRLDYLKGRIAWAFKAERLYDLAQDPRELNDVGGRQGDRLQNLETLRNRLLAHRPAPTPAAATPDRATLERLEALGYIN